MPLDTPVHARVSSPSPKNRSDSSAFRTLSIEAPSRALAGEELPFRAILRFSQDRTVACEVARCGGTRELGRRPADGCLAVTTTGRPLGHSCRESTGLRAA